MTVIATVLTLLGAAWLVVGSGFVALTVWKSETRDEFLIGALCSFVTLSVSLMAFALSRAV